MAHWTKNETQNIYDVLRLFLVNTMQCTPEEWKKGNMRHFWDIIWNFWKISKSQKFTHAQRMSCFIRALRTLLWMQSWSSLAHIASDYDQHEGRALAIMTKNGMDEWKLEVKLKVGLKIEKKIKGWSESWVENWKKIKRWSWTRKKVEQKLKKSKKMEQKKAKNWKKIKGWSWTRKKVEQKLKKIKKMEQKKAKRWRGWVKFAEHGQNSQKRAPSDTRWGSKMEENPGFCLKNQNKAELAY